MREIKFRGRDTDGNWHYGDLLRYVRDSYDMIIPDGYASSDNLYDDAVSVDYETVGQYTGKKDVNKKDIFEGDVVLFCDSRAHERIGFIKWHEKMYCWIIDCGEAGRVIPANYAYEIMLAYYACEIIGNVYDNPELLEVEA